MLVQRLSASGALSLDAASFVVSAVCVWRVRLAEPPAPAERKSIWHDIGQGLGWLRDEPIVFRLTLCIGLANLAWYGVQAVTIVYATRDLGLPPATLGLALGVMGPSSLVGALTASPIARRFGLGPRLVAALSGAGVSARPVALGAQMQPHQRKCERDRLAVVGQHAMPRRHPPRTDG